MNRTNPSTIRLTDLRPYTTYRISVALIGEDGKQGPRSLPQLAQTLQDRPEPPEDLQVRVQTWHIALLELLVFFTS